MNPEFTSDFTGFSHEANSLQKLKITCEYQECSKIFKSKKTLKDHLKIHKGERPYSCNYSSCEKAFTQYSSFQKHKRTHSGEKPYTCQSCSQAFTQASNLKRHERIHNGEKPHECHICSKLFVTTSNLKQHIQTHLETKKRSKYKCSECGKEYNYNSSLKKHTKAHQNFETNEQSPNISVNDEFIKQNLKDMDFLRDDNIDPQPQLLDFNSRQPSFNQNNFSQKSEEDDDENRSCSSENKNSDSSSPSVQKTKYQVFHHDHMDTLEDSKLQHLNEHGLIEEHQLEKSFQNPIPKDCNPLKEITHIPRLVEFITKYDSIMKEKNLVLSLEKLIGSCSALTCSKQKVKTVDKHHTNHSADKGPHSTPSAQKNTLDCECLSTINTKVTPTPTNQKDDCICLETQFLKHHHSDDCGHPKILHEDHYDYIVDGHLHYVHGNHCDDHGLIMIADEFCKA